MTKPQTEFLRRIPQSVEVTPNPIGWQAVPDFYDGASDSEWPCTCIGYGDTAQEAVDELYRDLELPFSVKVEDLESPHEHRWVDDDEFSHGNEQGQTCGCGMARRIPKNEEAAQ